MYIIFKDVLRLFYSPMKIIETPQHTNEEYTKTSLFTIEECIKTYPLTTEECNKTLSIVKYVKDFSTHH